MPIGSLLDHRVSVVTRVAIVDEEGAPVHDHEGQVMTTDRTRLVAVAIQPKAAREVTAPHQAGAPISTHTIFATDLDIRAADALIHDPEACGKTRDLPFGQYELTGVGDAAGRGHHVEIDAILTAPTVPGGAAGSGETSGSGS
jgi:hypothetical protein